MTQQGRSFQAQITKTVQLNYLLYFPKGYHAESEKKWPLILFLHGFGERGSNPTDLDLLKKHGLPRLIAEGKDFPFIIASPQCPAQSWWPHELDAMKALLDHLLEQHPVDKNRVYLTGLSMGGYGSWRFGCAYPELFAAIAPICGGGVRGLVEPLKNTPVWVFHGAKDTAVPLALSEEMVHALEEVGGTVRFTVYPEAGHDSWTETYNNPELYDWFLSNVRKP